MVTIVTMLRAGWSGFGMLGGATDLRVFQKKVQTDCRATQPRIKWVPMFSCVTSFFLPPGMHGWLVPAQLVCHELSDVTQCCHNGCGSLCEECTSYYIPVRMCVCVCVCACVCGVWRPVMWAASQLFYICKYMITVTYLCHLQWLVYIASTR